MEIIYTDKDGTTVKFTEEMAIAAITERDELRVSLNDCQERASRYYSKLLDVRQNVYEFFNMRNDGDDEDITCTIDDINALLRGIGAEELKKLWTVEGTVTYTVIDIPASSKDEAESYIYDNLELTMDDNDASLDDWSVETTRANEQ